MFSKVKQWDCLLVTYTFKNKLVRTNYFVVREILEQENQTVFIGELKSGFEYIPYRIFINKENIDKQKIIFFNGNIKDTYTIISTTSIKEF